MNDGSVVVEGWDGTRFWCRGDNLIERDIIAGGFEVGTQRAMAALVRPGDAVIDAGANIGVHACPLGRRVGPAGRVLAVEPVPALADRLEANLRLNGLANVTTVRAAVSSADGERAFHAPEPGDWNSGQGGFHLEFAPGRRAIQVETTTIDRLVAAHELAALRLIKLDIEGHEVEALLGARATLAAHRPYVVFEHGEATWAAAGRTFAEARALLVGELGYRLRPLGGRIGGYVNVLATPRAG